MTRVDKIQEVRTLKYVAGLPIREIVRRVKLSRNTVRKILRSGNTEFAYRQREKTYQPVTDPIKETIKNWIIYDQTQKKKYRRKACRMYELLQSVHGYKGSYESVAKCVREVKRELEIEQKEVYIPLFFCSGEAFQFDWGEVMAYIDGKLVTLQLAVIELCYSRHFYARTYPCQKQELMLDAHRRAFEFFGGVCKRGIYDNLKSAVKKLLRSNHRRLQEKFVRFCSHYLYKPDFCNPARGNEKGRVEGMVCYVRSNYFTPIPRFNSLEELNDRLISFCISHSRNKQHPEIQGKTRYEAYLEEKDNLISLQKHAFECCRENFSLVDSCSRIFFDNNRYSVPDEYVGRHVLVRGYSEEIAASYDGREIARHKRLYGYKQQSLQPQHYLETLRKKPGALKNGLPFKNWELPEIFLHYRKLLNEKYDDGDRYFAKTLVLLKEWSIKEVVAAINKAIEMGILGDSYLVGLLRQQKEGIFEKECISIKVELSRYSAKQNPPEQYDKILRNRIKQKDLEEIQI